MAASLNLVSKPKCWLCTAPFRANTQGVATYLECKSCGLVSHLKCASRKNCCFVVAVVEKTWVAPRPGGKRQTSGPALSTFDEEKMDCSFVFSASPNIRIPALHSSQPITSGHAAGTLPTALPMTTVTTTSAIAPPTFTVSTSGSILTTSFYAGAPSQPVVSPVLSNASLISTSVDAALSTVKEGNPNFAIVVAMRSMASAISASFGGFAQKVDLLSSMTNALAESNREFQDETRGYFLKTAPLEAAVSDLIENDRVHNRAIADVKSEAVAASRGYEIDTLKIVGLPYSDPEMVKSAVVALGPKIGIKIAPNAIASVNFGRDSDPEGPEQMIDEAAGRRARRPREVFVRLVYAEMRDMIITRLGKRKGILLRELDPSAAEDRPIPFYEMLVPERYRTFRALMVEAKRLRIRAFWHSFGQFFARTSDGGAATRIFDVEDLRRLTK